jgi:hypothetical protein
MPVKTRRAGGKQPQQNSASAYSMNGGAFVVGTGLDESSSDDDDDEAVPLRKETPMTSENSSGGAGSSSHDSSRDQLELEWAFHSTESLSLLDDELLLEEFDLPGVRQGARRGKLTPGILPSSPEGQQQQQQQQQQNEQQLQRLEQQQNSDNPFSWLESLQEVSAPGSVTAHQDGAGGSSANSLVVRARLAQQEDQAQLTQVRERARESERESEREKEREREGASENKRKERAQAREGKGRFASVSVWFISRSLKSSPFFFLPSLTPRLFSSSNHSSTYTPAP